jgi:hypothetical protein
MLEHFEWPGRKTRLFAFWGHVKTDPPPQQNICLWTEHVATARAAYGRPGKQPKIRVTQSLTLSFS